MAYRTYDYGRRPSTIYEEDEADSYYRPSLHSASPRVNLADLPDSSFIDYDLVDDTDSLYDYDPSRPERTPTPSYRRPFSSSPQARSATVRRPAVASPLAREIPDFEAETTSRAHYTWKDPQRPQKARSSTPSDQTVPFYAETTNRDTFTWKDPEKRTKRASPSERELPPFYDETTHKSEFIKKIPTKEQSIKQPTHRSNDVPFYSETSNRAHFTPKQVDRTRAIKRANTLGFDGELASKTTTKETYQPKAAAKQKSLRPSDAKLFDGNNASVFSDRIVVLSILHTSFTTTNKQVFTPKASSQCPAEYYISKREKLHHVGKHYYIKHLQKVPEERPDKATDPKYLAAIPKVTPPLPSVKVL